VVGSQQQIGKRTGIHFSQNVSPGWQWAQQTKRGQMVLKMLEEVEGVELEEKRRRRKKNGRQIAS